MSERRFDVLAGFLEEAGPHLLRVDFHGELGEKAAARLVVALGYFATTGRLPDPSVPNMIQHHPYWGGEKRELKVCRTCQDLYEGQEACWKFMHPLVSPDEAPPLALDHILASLDRRQEEKERTQAVNNRYPFPEERADHTYPCQACGKSFTIQGSARFSLHDYGEKRIACSKWCEFDLIGRPRPEGRKYRGFMALNPFFKGGQVFYFGRVNIPDGYPPKERICECYLWKMTPDQANGNFYAYYGEGETDYFHWISGASANRVEQMKILENGSPIEESWRILANVKDSYSWRVAP